MPPSLRKACHACVSAKRKCNPQLPACERCIKKHLRCMYDLEPITQSIPDRPPDNGMMGSTGSNVQQFRIVYDSVPNARDASASAMASGLSSDSSAAHPLLMADGETAIWLMKWFTEVAQNGIDGKATPFVHSQVVDSFQETRAETDKFELTDVEASVRFLSRKLQTQREDVISVLTRIHHLIIAALQRLLLDKPSIRRELETERIVQCLYSTAHTLWSTADTLTLQNLQSCEAWRIAESIRRSMFAAIFTRGIWAVVGSGYCHYEPFLESLPFDARAGLWEAETEGAWSTIVNQMYRGEHTQLRSWHEFTEGATGKRLSSDEDGQLQRMLYVSFHGSDGIRWLEQVDQRKFAKVL